MDTINAKLWEKYQLLKKRKAEEMETHAVIEANVRKYERASEEMFEALRSENEELHAQLLLKEDEYAESQKLLMEERRKIKELSIEIEKLRSSASPRKACVEENGCKEIVTRKIANSTPESTSKVSHQKPSEKPLSNSPIRCEGLQNGENGTPCDYLEKQVMPDCCRGTIHLPGNETEISQKCVFQTLLESIVGLKFTIDVQSNLPHHFSVVHHSSGYSFKLTWLPNAEWEDGEWFYQVLSLGTLERVALEWMREDIRFSSTMFHIFFQRMSRVLGRVQ